MNKLILSLLLILSSSSVLIAQAKAPKWMNKSRKAVVNIATFDKDNRQIRTGTGFFVSEDGEILTSYTLLKGAAKAQATDVEGKTYPIERIWGADEMYDVIRIQASIPKKVTFLPIAQLPAQVGNPVYLMPFSTEKKLKDPYAYYKVSFPLSAGDVNSPLLLETGEVIGLAQEDASGKNEQSYAVSAGYAHSLSISSTDLLSSTYNSLLIRKAWPKEVNQAIVALFLKRSTQTPQDYLETLNDFIATFPTAPDGYISRASHYAAYRKIFAATPTEEPVILEKALNDINTAANYTTAPGDVYYNRAKLIFETVVADTTITQSGWSIEDALQSVTQAIEQEDKPIYRQLQGDIYFYLQKYEEAYQAYMIVNESEMANAETYYIAAKALENTTGFNIGDVIGLLDKAIEKTGTPPGPDAANYLLERVEWKTKLMMYDEAIADYNLYYQVVGGRVEAPFYYYREQAKFRAGDLEGALSDIQQAIQMNPVADYFAEAA
jgi:tetratricopeptide (TPR) repeat protein